MSLEKIKIDMIDSEINNENDVLFYGIYRPIRFYHTTPKCKIFKKYLSIIKKNKEIKELDFPIYEIEQFETKDLAIKNGYVFPCPICAFSVANIFKFKINGNYIQVPLDGLDIIILLYISNLFLNKNKIILLKDIKINISIKIIKSAIKTLKEYKIITSNSDGYKLTKLGEAIIYQIRKDVGDNLDNLIIEKVFDKYLSKYKLFRRIEDYEKHKERKINLKEEFQKLKEIAKQNNTNLPSL